jgi:hypothetical protein
MASRYGASSFLEREGQTVLYPQRAVYTIRRSLGHLSDNALNCVGDNLREQSGLSGLSSLSGVVKYHWQEGKMLD